MDDLNSFALNYVDVQSTIKRILIDSKKMKKIRTELSKIKNKTEPEIEDKIKYLNYYFQWFDSAWNSLNNREQLVLKEFYGGENLKSDAEKRLVIKFNCSRSSVYRLKKEAIANFFFYLYGIEGNLYNYKFGGEHDKK